MVVTKHTLSRPAPTCSWLPGHTTCDAMIACDAQIIRNPQGYKAEGFIQSDFSLMIRLR